VGQIFEKIGHSTELEAIICFVYDLECLKLTEKGMSPQDAAIELTEPRASTFLKDLGVDSLKEFFRAVIPADEYGPSLK
jgi:hypothetical protein